MSDRKGPEVTSMGGILDKNHTKDFFFFSRYIAEWEFTASHGVASHKPEGKAAKKYA